MTGESDLERVYSAGYFLIRRQNPDHWRGEKPLLPDSLISLSRCICPYRLDITWGWHLHTAQEPLEPLREFGIPDHLVGTFSAWCRDGFKQDDADWAVFPSVDSVRRFVTRFQLPSDSYVILGAGRPRDVQPPDQRGFHVADERTSAVWSRAPVAIETGGRVLGYEVVSFDYGDFSHSWLCSGLHLAMAEQFGIRPNQNGLIDQFEQAQRVRGWIAEDNMQGTRAEPEPYFVWLLVSYPM